MTHESNSVVTVIAYFRSLLLSPLLHLPIQFLSRFFVCMTGLLHKRHESLLLCRNVICFREYVKHGLQRFVLVLIHHAIDDTEC